MIETQTDSTQTSVRPEKNLQTFTTSFIQLLTFKQAAT